jgi:CRP/FNR family transcriptional regulator
MELTDFFTDPKLLEDIRQNSHSKSVSKADLIIAPGDPVQFVPLVLQGSLRIMREDEAGREVFLYHIHPGETCAMSLNCCQAGKNSMIRAVVEEDAKLLMVPVKQIESWFSYPEWRSFINTTYANRFIELLNVIDLIAFNSMDKQLLHYLQERAKALHTQALYITHQEIADELHTHREAISRLLRSMEQKEIVRLGRNIIEIL